MSRAPDFAEIRRERPADADAIRALLLAAFPTPAEADLVAALRADGDLVLGLVAEGGDGLAGYVGFSRASVAGRPALALAPLAVADGRRIEGVGSRLVRAGIRELETGFSGPLVVLGDPIWYGRFGFAPAAGLVCRWSSPHLLAMTIGAPAAAAAGDLVYARAFDAL
ncbi:MAG: N-acetyltransferase [Methylobacteriaceae bacterium]|nr:N-acetyltransferase [Methylobacteriaceae bacterium]